MSSSVITMGSELEEHVRQRKDGTVKQRYTMTIRSDKLVVNTSSKALLAPVAAAVVKHLRERIEDISEQAAPRTLQAREVAKRALAAGKSWATKRYGGGRTGVMEPGQTDRLFNDSERLARTMSAQSNDGETWRINAAANRWNVDAFGLEGLTRIWEKLKSLVPEFGNPDLFGDVLPVQAALRQSIDEAIQIARGELFDQVLDLVNAGIDKYEQLDEIAG